LEKRKQTKMLHVAIEVRESYENILKFEPRAEVGGKEVPLC